MLGVVSVRVGSAADAEKLAALEMTGQVQRFAGWNEWTASEFEVDSAHPIPLGIDGEAFVLDPPVRFRIRPRTLRVRISPRHPGASPSAMEPDRFGDSVRALAAVAAGRLPTTPSRAG